MEETIKVGLWGCGGMGNSLARGLAAIDKVSLDVVYDIDPSAAANAAGRYGARVAESAQSLLATPDLEGVIIALPPHLHAMAAIQAAEAGRHVFVEKPMALSTADCRHMIDAARQNDVLLMVGQVLRYYEPYRSILRWQEEGRFGRLYAAAIWRVVDDKVFSVKGHWRNKRASCGGYLFEVGAHELDMLRCLLGEPRAVCAVMQKVLPRPHEIEDHIAVQVRFDSGGSAVYEGGTGSNARRYGFRFYFERATLVSEQAFNPQALRIYGPDGDELPVPTDEFSQERPVKTELRLWLDAIRGRSPVPIPGEEGMATVSLIEAAYRSAAEGQTVILAKLSHEEFMEQ